MSDGRLFFGRFLLCLRVAFNSTWCATANRRGRERHQQRATGAGTRPGPGSPSSPGRAKAEGNKASARLAGVNAREREPGEGWRVLETAVVRVQAGGANCCTGESTRLATDWTASRARMERMARESKGLRSVARLELRRRRGCFVRIVHFDARRKTLRTLYGPEYI